MYTIKECVTPEEIKSTFAVMQQLRPNIKNDQYIDLINSLKATEGYSLVAAYNTDNECVAVAGIRFRCSLFREGGKELYVDDLVTDETRRGSGIGHELITWLKAECKKEQCVGLVLDSDQVRKDAYRFYVREGMDTTALHFYRSKSPELEHQSSKLDVDKTTNALTIKNCVTPEEIKSTFTIMRQLRPNIKNDQYIELINSLKTTESYQLIAAYNADNVCVAVAGIRFRCSLFREGGKELYVDDLVTDETRRGSGIGHELMIWLKAACKKEQCAGIVLDSGLTRKDAHRFYQREGMSATAFHFYRAKSPERDSKTSIVDSKKDINWDSRISLKR